VLCATLTALLNLEELPEEVYKIVEELAEE
jgi:hypothetical protein